MNTSPDDMTPSTIQATLKFAVLCVGMVMALLLFWVFDAHTWLSFETLPARIAEFGWFGPVVFVAIFALSIILIMPASILTLVGATLFDPITAYLAIFLGAMLGATGCFGLGRGLGRAFVMQRLARSKGRWAKVLGTMDDALTRHGFRAMLYLRLGPLPFAIPSYGAALSGIRFKHFFMGTALGSLPQILVFVFLGDTLKRLFEQGTVAMLTAWQSWAAVGCFVAVFAIPLFIPKRLMMDEQ